MVAKTFEMNSPAVTKDRAESRSDMFAQSSALYSRINKKSKTSPWMIIAPAAIVVIVGGALFASTGSHKTAAPVAHTNSATTTQTTTAPIPAQAAPKALSVNKSETLAKTAPAAKPVQATPAPKAAAVQRPTASRAAVRTTSPRVEANDSTSAPSAYDNAKPAPAPLAAPAPVTPAPVESVTAPVQATPAPVQAAPATTAPDTTTAPPAAPAPTSTPQA